MNEFDKQLTIKEQFFRDFKKLYDKYNCCVWFSMSNGKATGITEMELMTNRKYGAHKFSIRELLNYMWPSDKRFKSDDK